MKSLGRAMLAIHACHTSNFKRSSELLTLWTVCCAFGHASQPGKSNTQNSRLKARLPPSFQSGT